MVVGRQRCCWPGLYLHVAQGETGQKQEHKEKSYLTPARGLARGTEPAELRGRRKSFYAGKPPSRGFARPAPLASLVRSNLCPQGNSLSLPPLHLLRASAALVRSGSDERARDQSFLLLQPPQLCSVCAKLMPEVGLQCVLTPAAPPESGPAL